MTRREDREPGPSRSVKSNPADFVRRLRAIEEVQWAGLKPFFDETQPLPGTPEELMLILEEIKRMLQALLTLKMDVLNARQDVLENGRLTEEKRGEVILGYDTILRSIDIVFDRVSRTRSKVRARLQQLMEPDS